MTRLNLMLLISIMLVLSGCGTPYCNCNQTMEMVENQHGPPDKSVGYYSTYYNWTTWRYRNLGLTYTFTSGLYGCDIALVVEKPAPSY